MTPLAAVGAAPEAAVAIAGAKDNELALTTIASQFATKVTIYATSSEVKGIRYSVAPLVGPSGKQVSPVVTLEPSAANETFDLGAAGEAELQIKADLTEVGIYQSGITLIYDGRRTVTRLTVQRTRPELPVEILGLQRVRSTSSSPEFWLTARPTGSSTLKLQGPDLLELSLEETENSKLQASFDKIELKDEEGQPLSGPFELPPETVRRIRLAITDLGSAGTYKGKIQLSAKDYLPRSAELTFQLRDGWLFALFFITLGVAASYGLRFYALSGRPRLVRRRRLVALQGDLKLIRESLDGGGASTNESKVLGVLQRRLEGLDEDLALGMESNTDDKLTAIDGQLALLPRWLTLGRRIEELEPPSLRPAFQRKLALVTAHFEIELPTTDQKQNADKTLLELETEIPKAVREELEGSVVMIKNAIQNPALASGAAKLRLTAEVLPALARAMENSAREQPVEARREYLAARGAYARILAEDLAATVEKGAGPPSQDAGTWAKLTAEVQKGLKAAGQARDPDQAVALYERSATLYLASLARAWAEDISETETAIRGNGSLKEEEKTTFIASLNTVREKLQGAAAKAEQCQLADAAADYQVAQSERGKVVNALQAKGVPMGGPQAGAAASAPANVPTAAGEPQIFPVAPWSARDRPTVRDLSRRLLWRDIWFSLALLAIVVLLGLKVLWVPDPTWGGVDDYFVAALWGLGLHQVAAGAAFEGIAALMGRFQK